MELRGDEALCVFDDPAAAVRAAVELQDAFAHEAAADPARALPVGMGLDIGTAVPMGDGFRGAALNLAARLCSATAQLREEHGGGWTLEIFGVESARKAAGGRLAEDRIEDAWREGQGLDLEAALELGRSLLG